MGPVWTSGGTQKAEQEPENCKSSLLAPLGPVWNTVALRDCGEVGDPAVSGQVQVAAHGDVQSEAGPESSRESQVGGTCEKQQ